MNGGLFENLDYFEKENNQGRKILVDGFSEVAFNRLFIPDYLFFSDAKGEKEGLINILNHYKFTVTENTPIEEEIALDPELLGKVFENLLARYNPETSLTVRKEKGAFYTPREIVDYMVNESIKNAISKKVAEKKGSFFKDLATGFDMMFAYTEEDKLLQENPFFEGEAKEIVKAIFNLKIFDPACGSGAFPMGILHKLVYVLNIIDKKNIGINKFLKKKENIIQGVNTPDYARKLFLIENVIYGADIQPMAIQISKLRFFISLIVEQESSQIEPLPNLETKFVISDSLISLSKTNDADQMNLFDNPLIVKKEFEIEKIRHEYFYATDLNEKLELRKKDLQIRNEISELIKESSGDAVRAKKIVAWDPYNRSSQAKFFDPFWMFGLKKGFDVVIGNPPYIQIQKFSGKEIQQLWANERYDTFIKTGDVYCLFYERGNQLLTDGGILAFITSNKWMRAKYGEKTRSFFANNTQPLILIDFANNRIFENATVGTNIIIFQKKNKKAQIIVKLRACVVNENYKTIKYDKSRYNSKIDAYFNENAVVMDNLSSESWVILCKKEMEIKKQIEKVGTPLKDWDIKINRGILTGYNEAFIIDQETRDKFIKADPKSAEILKPILRGRDIKRYKSNFANLWLIFIPWHFPYHENGKIKGASLVAEEAFKNCYPIIFSHLYKNFDKLSKRSKSETGIRYEWYALQRCAATYYKEFKKKKISWGNLGLNSQFALIDNEIFLNAPSPLITPANKYLLAILNSKIGDYYIRSCGVTRNGGYFEYKPMFVEKFPVPQISSFQQQPFETIVDCIIFAKENSLNKESETFEAVIDNMVYDLYFEDEMKKSNSYITDRINEVVLPFKDDDTPEFKLEYINKFYNFCKKDKTVSKCLIYNRTVNTVKIINGALK